jgi:hypothetical protein
MSKLQPKDEFISKYAFYEKMLSVVFTDLRVVNKRYLYQLFKEDIAHIYTIIRRHTGNKTCQEPSNEINEAINNESNDAITYASNAILKENINSLIMHIGKLFNTKPFDLDQFFNDNILRKSPEEKNKIIQMSIPTKNLFRDSSSDKSHDDNSDDSSNNDTDIFSDDSIESISAINLKGKLFFEESDEEFYLNLNDDSFNYKLSSSESEYSDYETLYNCEWE